MPAAPQFKSPIRDCDIDFGMLESQLRHHVVPCFIMSDNELNSVCSAVMNCLCDHSGVISAFRLLYNWQNNLSRIHKQFANLYINLYWITSLSTYIYLHSTWCSNKPQQLVVTGAMNMLKYCASIWGSITHLGMTHKLPKYLVTFEILYCDIFYRIFVTKDCCVWIHI